MSKFTHPIPINREVFLDPSKVIMSKTDYKGVIQYGNEYFIEVSKYEIYEMMGRPHNIIRHPDMPKVIFKFMWEQLHRGENIYAVVKNLAKDGSFYWVMTCFETTSDDEGNIIAHYARRKSVPSNARNVFEKLYSKILSIEKEDEKAAENYFHGFIDNTGKSYDDLFLEIVGMNKEEINAYFQSKEHNSNVLSESTILDIDVDQVNQYEKSGNSNIELKQSVEDLKEQIELLKSALSQNVSKSSQKRSFFSRLFSDDD